MAINNDYFVIIKSDQSDLAKEVAHHLNQGCELVGGVSICYHPHWFPAKDDKSAILYAQALIQNKTNP